MRRTTPTRFFGSSIRLAAPQSVAILGGGLSGLTTAYLLSRRLPSAQITLYEASDRLGGWLQSRRVGLGGEGGGGGTGELIFEGGPRSVRPPGLAGAMTLDLVRQLGLLRQLITVPKSHPSARNRYIYYPDRLTRLPSSVPSFLASLHRPLLRPLPGAGLRDLVCPRAPRSPEEWAAGDESVDAFFARRFGLRIAETLASAMVHGIYAADSRQLSVRGAFPFLWEAERHSGGVIQGLLSRQKLSLVEASVKLKEKKLRESVTKAAGPSLQKGIEEASVWSLKGGLSTLSDRMAEALKAADNVQVKLGSKDGKVGRLTRGGRERYTVSTPAGQATHTHLVSALAPPKLADLLSADFAFPATALTHNPSASVAVVNLAFPVPASSLLPVRGFGYLIPRATPAFRNPHGALGCVFDSEIVPSLDTFPTSAGGSVREYTKVSLMMGGPHWGASGAPELTRDAFIEQALATLKLQLDITAAPSHTFVSLQRDCIPTYLPGHLSRMAALHDALQGEGGRFAVVGSGYGGVGVNDCVKSAWEVVDGLADKDGHATGLEGLAEACRRRTSE